MSKTPLIATSKADLAREAERATKMFSGRTILRIWRHRPREVGIEFTDGSRFFIDAHTDGQELSAQTNGTPEGGRKRKAAKKR